MFKTLFFALLSGLLFGGGLAVSGMTQPEKVLGFLDLAGNWDPSLAFVMVGGISVNAIGLLLLKRTRKTPLCATAFEQPTSTAIDTPLLIGSGIFGIGWGIAGLCPGPVVANLLIHPAQMVPFLLVLLIGLKLGTALKPKTC